MLKHKADTHIDKMDQVFDDTKVAGWNEGVTDRKFWRKVGTVSYTHLDVYKRQL